MVNAKNMPKGNLKKIELWQCPKCEGFIKDFPALSRRDNKTEICSDCGVKEALSDYYGSLKGGKKNGNKKSNNS